MRAFHEIANRQQIGILHGKPLVKETLRHALVRASAALPILAAIPKVRNPPKSSAPKSSAIASHLAESSCSDSLEVHSSCRSSENEPRTHVSSYHQRSSSKPLSFERPWRFSRAKLFTCSTMRAPSAWRTRPASFEISLAADLGPVRAMIA